MKYSDYDEIDSIINEFMSLKQKAKKSKSKSFMKEFEAYQKYCIEKCKCLVTNRVGRYRKFSNYDDLEQDGYEALVLALRTYNPNKGSFTWWADKYISTRVARCANTHSTIRFPLKKAKDIKPFKISVIPTIIDESPSALSCIEDTETSTCISKAVKQLPEQQQRLVNILFGLNGAKQQSIGEASKTLDISRPKCLKILEQAKNNLKEKLVNI